MDRGSHVPNLRIIRKIYNHSRSSALDLAHVKCKLKQTLNTASLMLGLLRHFFILNFKNPWSGSVWKFRSLGFCEYRNNQGCGKCFPFLFSEMPTSGYLKSGDSLFCTTAPIPPPECQQPYKTPLPTNWPSCHGLGRYMKSCMKYRLSKFAFIFVSD